MRPYLSQCQKNPNLIQTRMFSKDIVFLFRKAVLQFRFVDEENRKRKMIQSF